MKRILVVDDTEVFLLLFESIFEDVPGLVVDTERDSTQVIQRLKGEHYDMIILDLMMPEIDGFQLIELMRSQAGTRDIPVVVTTAMPEDEVIGRLSNLGVIGFIPKPMQISKLRAKILGLLQLNRQVA